MGWPGPMTRRQYLAWQQWLADQWNKPTRTDEYLNSIATEVRRSYAKNPRSVKSDHLRLKFKFERRGRKRRLTQEEVQYYSAVGKAKWIGATGGKFQVVNPTPRQEGGE